MVSTKIKVISEDVLKANDLIPQLTGRDCETGLKRKHLLYAATRKPVEIENKIVTC